VHWWAKSGGNDVAARIASANAQTARCSEALFVDHLRGRGGDLRTNKREPDSCPLSAGVVERRSKGGMRVHDQEFI
jgi:hypothetical protein